MLEFFINKKIRFLAEKYSLLSYNHFGSLKQKTTIDTLRVFQ